MDIKSESPIPIARGIRDTDGKLGFPCWIWIKESDLNKRRRSVFPLKNRRTDRYVIFILLLFRSLEEHGRGRDQFVGVEREAGDIMENTDNFDRISDLPEPILHHIMSFLLFKQAVQTSVLSKIWQQAWNSFPILHFDNSVFNDDLRYHSFKGDDPAKKKKLLMLFNSVGAALRNRHKQMISIKKFTVELFNIMPLVQVFEPFIDQCIFYAIETDVKELRLKVSDVTEPKDWQYKLPQVVLCSKSINVLVLGGCMLESPTSVRLSSLRELHLSSVKAADQVIEDLLAGCPLLEVLHVCQCLGFKILELLGHSKLSDITISSNEELDRLVIKGLSVRSFTIKSLPIPREVNLASCKNLKSLHISMVSVTDEWLSNQISYFPVLECLIITLCHMLTCVKLSSLHLKELCINDCNTLGEVKIETPNLRIFKYEGDIVSFASDVLTLSKTVLLFHSENMDTQWFGKYIELLSRFQSFSKTLILRSSMGENLIIPEELRQIQRSPLCNVEHLNMVVPLEEGIIVAVKDAVDGLLWISPHAKTVSLEPYYPLNEYYFFKFQFSYKGPPVYEGGIAQCCKSCPISCWQECIDEVQIEYCTGKDSEDGKDVKRYIFKGGDIWEKINSLIDLSIAEDPLSDWNIDYILANLSLNDDSLTESSIDEDSHTTSRIDDDSLTYYE